MKLRLAHLYPRLMNIYGDRGNIICLRRRCETRGIDFEVSELEPGDAFDPAAYDMAFIGGAQDREQQAVAEDLIETKGEAVREGVDEGNVVLAVCGGYQLMGHFYREASGRELPGLGILDIWTAHPGPEAKRFIGNVVIEWQDSTLVGFENHGGRTYVGKNAQPLGKVITGFGNNGKDGSEGATYKSVFGTYLHGSLLPKNPQFADNLIRLALVRKYPDVQLSPLDDMVETMAHEEAVRLATRKSFLGLRD
jgi:CobQ-like glutamine amidotransferase family enzyme